MNRRWCFLVICAACVPTRLQRYKLRKQELLDPKLHRCHDNDESNYVDEYEDDDDEVFILMLFWIDDDDEDDNVDDDIEDDVIATRTTATTTTTMMTTTTRMMMIFLRARHMLAI